MYPSWSKVALAGLVASASAQTYSECNPMKKTCDPNAGLAASSYTIDFTKGADDDNWKNVGHGDVTYTSEGAEFSVSKKNTSPTLQSNWYMFFGRLEVHMKAAPGQGIVSSIVFLSDVLDEVDWEFLGGRDAEVQTNYYGKASTDNTQSMTFAAPNNQAEFHNYTVHWTQESIEWYVNDVAVRTLKYSDADGGETFPQTPMRVKLGIWAGGDPDNAEGTIEWAGGETDYDGVPYTMTVQKIKIENLNPAESYTYSDDSGSYKSIKFDKKDNGGSSDDDEDDKDEESSTSSEAASKTASTTASETTMQTATKTDSSSDSESTTASSDEASETDFKNNKAAESTGASATSTETSASATATETNSAAGNWPKMWLGLAAICAAMVMM
ncbi:concanavalin A-like lectin/glucanase domain-containing protein [Fusarium avenaceum]|nr:concanavalin A-like lectin/glucanase domain-containing protein [Fusarium avenaceum]